jgi:hypothetical protein
MNFTGVRLKITYSSTSLKPGVSFRNPFKEVLLNKKKKVVIERHTEEPGIFLDGNQIHVFGHECITPEICHPIHCTEVLPRNYRIKFISLNPQAAGAILGDDMFSLKYSFQNNMADSCFSLACFLFQGAAEADTIDAEGCKLSFNFPYENFYIEDCSSDEDIVRPDRKRQKGDLIKIIKGKVTRINYYPKKKP